MSKELSKAEKLHLLSIRDAIPRRNDGSIIEVKLLKSDPAVGSKELKELWALRKAFLDTTIENTVTHEMVMSAMVQLKSGYADDVDATIKSLIRHLYLGKILTIIDGTYTNPVQNKAVKDLVQDVFKSNDSIITDELFLALEQVVIQAQGTLEFLEN